MRALPGSGDGIAIGAATDPYQPAEGRYRLTRGCLEVLARAANPFSLITSGPLVVRDVDVLQEASARADVSVTFSVPTLDEDVWRTTEPGTAPPRQRLRALRELVDAGVKASVGMAPILPGLSDRPEQLAEVVKAAREAGATGIWANLLYLRPAPASTSSTHSRATGRSSSGTTSGSTTGAPTCRRRRRSPCGRSSGSSRGSTACATAARCRGPPRAPEQLSLAV